MNEALGPKDEVIVSNLHLVHMIAKRYTAFGRHWGIDYDDLYASGCEGLVRAYYAYDPTIAQFSTFAGNYIMNSIRTYVFKHSDVLHIPKEIKELRARVFKLGIEEDTAELIAETLGCSLKKARAVKSIISKPTSLDKHVRDDSERKVPLGELVSSRNDDFGIVDLNLSLTDKEKRLAYYCEAGFNQREIGEIIGCTQGNVWKMLRNLRRKLKEA